MSEARRILTTIFGYSSFRGRQEEVIEHLISGGDALLVMPTGGGKSLCYQIPAIARPGLGVVVSPLIALMRDQVETLKQLGVKAAYLNSTLSPSEAYAVERRAREGDLELLYLAPERAVTPGFLELLSQCKVSLIAIDEAHCVSQWGHDFRPEYLALSILSERFPGVPRIAVTATADGATRKEIVAKLALEDAKILIEGFDRPNIRYEVAIKQDPRAQLDAFLSSQPREHSGILYCLSRKKTEQTAEYLSKRGYRVYPYHAGLSAEVREQHQDIFLNEDGVLITATIAFGMGIDKPDVRFVAHLDLPKSIEAYYQETGRAGRDGEPAVAWTLYGMGDVVTYRQMIESSQAPEEQKRVEQRKLNSLLGYCETTRCRRQVLLSYFGQTETQPCGNCDTCLSPVSTFDGTRLAQMALSCVYRTGQRFGAAYLVDVLRGKPNERIASFGHDKLPTHGVGADVPEGQWFSIFRQLVAHGYLTPDIAGYGGLLLNASSKEVLTGKATVELRYDPAAEKRKKSKGRKASAAQSELSAGAATLFDQLRAKRMELAKAQGVPPYVIFHDRTLAEMAEQKPATLDQMRSINGIGEKKLVNYGEVFLAIVKESLAAG